MSGAPHQYFKLLWERKKWINLDSPIHIRMARYEAWLKRGYRPSRPTFYFSRVSKDQYGDYQRYDLGWRFGSIWGPQEGKYRLAMDMTFTYRKRKKWKRANTSTGHLFAWSVGQKAKRTWPSP